MPDFSLKAEFSLFDFLRRCDVCFSKFKRFMLWQFPILTDFYDVTKLRRHCDDLGADNSFLFTGVITFSTSAEHTIKLHDHADIDTFNEAVDKIPLMGKSTRIDTALRLAQNQLFQVGIFSK